MPNTDDIWEELNNAAQIACDSLIQHHFVHFAETMPHRIEEVIESKVGILDIREFII